MLLNYFFKLSRQYLWQGHGPELRETEKTLTGVKHGLGSDSWFGFYSLPLLLKDVVSYFPTLICWISFFLSLLSVGYTLLLDFLIQLERHYLVKPAFADPWMSRLFPPPPFFVFLIQHPLVPMYVPHASFVLPVLTEFSDAGACSEGCGLALAELFLCCRLLRCAQCAVVPGLGVFFGGSGLWSRGMV